MTFSEILRAKMGARTLKESAFSDEQRRFLDPDFYRSIPERAPASTSFSEEKSERVSPVDADEHGLFHFPALLNEEECHRLLAAIDRMTGAGLPGIFALTDEKLTRVFRNENLWRALRAALGNTVQQLPGIWVHDIAPGQRGWPAHVDEEGDPRGPVKKLSVWIALLGGGLGQGELYVASAQASSLVSQDYCSRERVDFGEALSLMSDVRARPISPGEGLGFSPHLLHYGGKSRDRRVAISMEFSSSVAAGSAVIPQRELNFDERLFLIAHNLEAYADEAREPLAHGFRSLVTLLRQGR